MRYLEELDIYVDDLMQRILPDINDKHIDEIPEGHRKTPLHNLALAGRVEILKHPSVDKVRSLSSKRTPLHFLASACKVEVLEHFSVDKVKDACGFTPLHILADRGLVPKSWIKEKYPWFNVEDSRITPNLITEILNAQNAYKFIGGI